MDNIIGAAPLAILNGIQDNSASPPVLNPETLPQHLPHVYLFCQTGPTLPQLVDSSAVSSLYGAATFNLRSPYATHATVLANAIQGAGGSMMLQRVLPSDAAPPAAFGLYLDLLAEPAVPQYQRNSDGTYLLDQTGKKQAVVGSGATAAGYIGKWVLMPITGPLGAGEVVAGSQIGTAGVQSQLYPICEFLTSFAGAAGNNLGAVLWAPTLLSDNPVNATLINSALSYIYRLQFVQRPDALSSAATITTIDGDQYVDFCFTPNVIDPATDLVVSYDQAVIPAYENLDTPGNPPVYGPFQQFYVYQNNLATILPLIYTAEFESGLMGLAPAAPQTNSGLVNLFGATDPNGVPYYNFTLVGPSAGGLLFSENTTQFASGGADGTMNFATFDTAVANQLANYGSLEAPLLDDALYPQSVIYDSGFTLPTKEAMLTPIGLRKDIIVVLSTQDVSLPANSGAEESSIAVALRTAANNYPESTMYGTSVCRAVVVGQCGKQINSQWLGILPLTIELATKAVGYMGAGNGVFKNGFGFDISPNNQITSFRDINALEKGAVARNNDWTTGLVWAQSYDRKSNFWPAVQTVYADDTSVLNSFINVCIAVELEKVCQRTWRDLTGITSLTNNQFIQRSNQLIQSRTSNRFDGRVIIDANTYFTSQDVARGYSWSCSITMYAPNMKTVGQFTVVARRKDDYPTAS
jgi:hypothetical protein